MYLNCFFQHSVLSMLPRLDDTEELVDATNSWMESACTMQNASFWDLTNYFPYNRTELWKWKDQIHLFNFGLPILMDKQYYDWPDLYYLDHVTKCAKSSIKVNI